MSRSLWKFTVFKPMNEHNVVSSEPKGSKNEIKTSFTNPNRLFFTNRASIISEKRINYRLFVYNGLRWYDFRVAPERVGHCVGEFAPTRKRPIPKKKKQVIKKK